MTILVGVLLFCHFWIGPTVKIRAPEGIYCIAWSAKKDNYGARCRKGKVVAEVVSVRRFSL
jgi:hypothetical protein